MASWIKDFLKTFRVRKARNISEVDRETCERYGEQVIAPLLAHNFGPDVQALYQTQEARNNTRDWLTETSDRRERRENVRYSLGLAIEIGVIVLIGIEIGLSIYYGNRSIREGKKEAEILDKVNQSTSDTAAAMKQARDLLKSLADVQSALQAERARKPRLALYVGNTPIDSAFVHLTLTKSSHDLASLDLLLKNSGDAALSPSRLHALMPDGVWIENDINRPNVWQIEPESSRFTVQLPLLPTDQTIHLPIRLWVPHGHPPVKIRFDIDAMELQSVVSLGSLTILPPN